ncbi:MAG TPA: diguanylate cyclase [Thermoanaerobaculia bacterium]
MVVAALLLVLLRVGLDIADRRIGVSYDPTELEIRILSVVPDGPAARAGVAAGDVLLAIDGQPLRESADFDRIAYTFARGRPVELEIARDDRRLRLEVVPGTDYDWGEFALGAIACLLYLGLGLIASSQRADDLRSTLLAGFCFAVAFELTLPWSLLGPETAGGLAANIAFRLVTGLQFGLELHLATVLPTTPAWLARHRWVVPAYYATGISIAAVAAASLAAAALGVQSVAPLAEASDELVFSWLLPAWAIAVAAIIGRRAFSHPDPRGRQQAGLVLIGVLPWVVVVLVDTLRPLVDAAAVPLPDSVWNYALLAYPLAVLAAIFLYQLFDLELVVRKSLLYGGLTSLLVLGFYALVGGIGALFARQFGEEGVPFWVLSSAGLTMGLLFNPLRSRLQREIDRRLFPERLALRSRLVALAGELPAQGKLPRMGEHLAHELERIFAVRSVTVWLASPPHGQLLQIAASGVGEPDFEQTALVGGDDPAVRQLAASPRPLPAATLAQASPPIGQRLRAVQAELVVPLKKQEILVGLLTVGSKRDGQRWAAEELDLLMLAGHHAATVFDNARLFDSATFEGLTGLYRREALLEILDREWSRSQRYARPLAVALVDLDHFKEVNDRFGHLTGDLVLQRVAAEMRNLLRETDFIGRYGGEEFLYVLPETTLDGAQLFAEKVRHKVESLEIATEAGKSVRVTASIGVAAREGGRDDGRARGRALVAAADEALYGAKREGRNRVEVAPERA